MWIVCAGRAVLENYVLVVGGGGGGLLLNCSEASSSSSSAAAALRLCRILHVSSEGGMVLGGSVVADAGSFWLWRMGLMMGWRKGG